MKRKNKLPKYWLGTAKPLSMGYQQNRGVGDSIVNTDYGESILPEVNAMRKNQIPNALGKFASASQYPMQALQNLKTTIYPGGVQLGSKLLSAGAEGIIGSGMNVAAANLPGTGVQWVQPSLQNTLAMASAPTGTVAQTTAKTALNTAGKVAGALGTAYGAYNVYNDIANAGQHRSAGQMLETRGQDTISTEYGNQYKQYRGIDAGAELGYAKQNRIGKQLGLAVDLMGLGASVGSIIPGLGTLFGAGLGAAAGLLGGGVASLLGFGDTEDETKEQLALATDQTARQNRQARAVAEDADMKSQFANRAANGKRPVWTPAGLVGKKATARVSNGEVIGNFQNGLVTRVPGQKNNKDTKLANLKDGDFVISNKYGLSDYAAATGDYAGALNLQEILMNGMRNSKGYKCGKLPKFAGGTWDTVFSMIPHGLSLASNIAQYNRAKAADTYAPDTYVDNAEGSKAVNELANLRYDARPYYTEALRGLNQANWNGRRQVALGAGGRAILQNANFNQYLNNLAKINAQENEANAGYRTTYANALANLGARNQQLRMQSAAQKHQWMQQANAARENWMAQYLKNIDTNLLNMASEYMRWGQYNDARAMQNKMLGLYEQQVDNDTYRTRRDMANLGNNTSTPITRQNKIEAPSMIARPSDDYGYIGSITNLLNGIQTPYTLQQNYKNWYNPQWGGIVSHKVR